MTHLRFYSNANVFAMVTANRLKIYSEYIKLHFKRFRSYLSANPNVFQTTALEFHEDTQGSRKLKWSTGYCTTRNPVSKHVRPDCTVKSIKFPNDGNKGKVAQGLDKEVRLRVGIKMFRLMLPATTV